MSCSFGAVGKLFFLCAAAVLAGMGLGGCLMKEFDTGILCLFLYTKENTRFLVETGIADL